MGGVLTVVKTDIEGLLKNQEFKKFVFENEEMALALLAGLKPEAKQQEQERPIGIEYRAIGSTLFHNDRNGAGGRRLE